MTDDSSATLGFTCAAESRRDNGELVALLGLVAPLIHSHGHGLGLQGSSGRWSSQRSSFENSPLDSTFATPRSMDMADTLRRAFTSSSRPSSAGQPAQSQSQSPQKRTMELLPPLASPPHSPSAPPRIKIKGRQWASALSYYTQSVRTRDNMMYGGVGDIRLPSIAGSSSSHMHHMLPPLGGRQGPTPAGVLTNPTALLSESLKRLDRHETLHLCDILGFHPSILNKLNGHPTELVEAMLDDVELEEIEFEEEQKYQREVMMASLISSWRAFRPEDCEDVPDADDYYDTGLGHTADNNRAGGNSTDPRLLLLLQGGGDTTHRGAVGKFTARFNALDESFKSTHSGGAPMTGRTDFSEKDRSPQMHFSGHKTGRTASSRLLLTRSSFRVSSHPNQQHTHINSPYQHTLSTPLSTYPLNLSSQPTHPLNPPILSTHPSSPPTLSPPLQGGMMGARTASFMLNLPGTSRGADLSHGLPVTSAAGLAPSVPTQGLTPSHTTAAHGGGGMNTSRHGHLAKTPRGNDPRYRMIAHSLARHTLVRHALL